METDMLDRITDIAESPLKHLERWFNELAAGMTAAGDTAEAAASTLDGDERFAQIIMMVHSRGIATGMGLAADEIAKARSVLHESLDEVKGRLS